MFRRLSSFLLVALAIAFAGHASNAAPFTAGNIVVVRVGSGSALTNAATQVFMDEYAPSGSNQTPVQSIAMPLIGAAADNKHLTLSGNNTLDGFVTRSFDSHYLVLTGYLAAPG